jgi:hypothetical protein
LKLGFGRGAQDTELLGGHRRDLSNPVPCRGRGDRARHRAGHERLARALLVHHRSRAAHKPLTEALAPTFSSVEIGVGVFALNQRAQMARWRRDGASSCLGHRSTFDREATSSRSLGRDNTTRMAYRDADALGLHVNDHALRRSRGHRSRQNTFFGPPVPDAPSRQRTNANMKPQNRSLLNLN